jgi:hypothetical protein
MLRLQKVQNLISVQLKKKRGAKQKKKVDVKKLPTKN